MQSHDLLHRDATEALYACARARSRRGVLWSALTGRSRCLLALEEVLQGIIVSHGERAETRQVPICQIRGSEGRCSDFDRDFNPLQDHNRVRWLRIAAARQRGRSLPPVELVQVGDLYFVRDGHHRVSVARALGQPFIAARVTALNVTEPLLLKTQTGARKPSWHKGLVLRLFDQVATLVRALRSDQRDEAIERIPGYSRTR